MLSEINDKAGINGNKYDNMNPKTLSEPQNVP